MTIKEKVISVIQRLPDDVDLKDVSEEIALLVAIEEAEQDIKEGKTISNDEMKERIAEWSAK